MNKQYRAQFSVTDIDSSLWWFTMKNHDWYYRWIRWYPMLFSDTLLYWSVKKSHLKVSRFWRLFRKFLFPPKQCCFSHVIHALPGKQLELPPIEHCAGQVSGRISLEHPVPELRMLRKGFAHLNPAWNDLFAGHLCSHRCTCALAFGSCSAERTGENITFGIPIKRMHQEIHLFFVSFAGVAAKNLGRCISCQMLMANQIKSDCSMMMYDVYYTPED